MSEKKASTRVAYLSVKYPTLLASFCAKAYPVKEDKTTIIEYREGKKDTIWVDEYIDCDTITGVVHKYYPVQVKSRDTIYQSTTIVSENKAEIALLRSMVSKLEASLEKAKGRGGNLFFLGLFCGAGIIFFILTIIKRVT